MTHSPNPGAAKVNGRIRPRFLKGFWKLSWVEIKIFMREPMGVISTFGIPVAIFLFLGRGMSSSPAPPAGAEPPPFNVAILAGLVIAVSAVISLVAIISIYREGGILKRLRATPLSPITILSAQVFIKLIFTAITLGLLILAGRRLLPGALDIDLMSFSLALMLSTLSILSLGFLIASVVPTARFAQPIAAGFLYPMLAFSGLFFSLEGLAAPIRIVTAILPMTHAVTLMDSIWAGAGWDWMSVAALLAIFVSCSALSSRVFRWE